SLAHRGAGLARLPLLRSGKFAAVLKAEASAVSRTKLALEAGPKENHLIARHPRAMKVILLLLSLLMPLPAFGAEPEPEPAPAPAPGKVEIQVQGGGQIRIQVAPQAAPEAGPAAARDAKPGYLGVQLDQTPAGQLQ